MAETDFVSRKKKDKKNDATQDQLDSYKIM